MALRGRLEEAKKAKLVQAEAASKEAQLPRKSWLGKKTRAF